MDEKLSVVYLVRPAEGGIRNHLVTLLAGLDLSRFEPVIICPPGAGIFEEAERAGYRVFPIDLPGELSLRRDLSAIARLRRLIRRLHPDILHIHGVKAGLVGRLAVALLPRRPKVLLTVHSFIFDGRTGPARRAMMSRVERCLARRTDRIIAVSNALKAELVSDLGLDSAKISVIQNGVHFREPLERRPLFQAARRVPPPEAPAPKTRNDRPLTLFFEFYGTGEPEPAPEPEAVTSPPARGPVIGTVARLAPQKGVDIFLRAAAIVRGEYPDARFVVVGDGPLKNTMEALAAKLEIRESVDFLGYRSDALELCAGFDVFALASTRETFGLTLVEALSQEVPVVASRVGGITEIIDGFSTGLLAEPGSAESLAAGIVSLLEDGNLAMRLGREGSRFVRSRFSSERMVRDTEQLYLYTTARTKAPDAQGALFDA